MTLQHQLPSSSGAIDGHQPDVYQDHQQQRCSLGCDGEPLTLPIHLPPPYLSALCSLSLCSLLSARSLARSPSPSPSPSPSLSPSLSSPIISLSWIHYMLTCSNPDNADNPDATIDAGHLARPRCLGELITLPDTHTRTRKRTAWFRAMRQFKQATPLFT